MSAPHFVPVIVGPTASGKTDVSIFLAESLSGEIISADSRQIYRHLDIGTAKPTAEQQSRVKHHCIDELSPDRPFNAGEFGVRGRDIIRQIFGRKKVPVVVGGSGLYIRSLIDGLFEGPSASPEIRELLENRILAEGIGNLLDELRKVDPESASRADPTKPRRIIRALEIFYLTGKPISQHHRESTPQIGFTPVIFGLEWERSELYRRIEKRCDAMLHGGLLDEIEALEALGFNRRVNALNTVGYAEGFAYRAGEISWSEMNRLFKQNSRRYAKRQLTWFRADKRVSWLSMSRNRSPELIAEEIAGDLTGLHSRPHRSLQA